MIHQRRRLNRLPGPVIGALLLEMGDIPELPGARCRGRHGVFDEAIEGSSASFARKAARQICATCPALAACGQWVEATIPYRRPQGIVAGRLVDSTGRFPAEVARKRRQRHAAR